MGLRSIDFSFLELERLGKIFNHLAEMLNKLPLLRGLCLRFFANSDYEGDNINTKDDNINLAFVQLFYTISST